MRKKGTKLLSEMVPKAETDRAELALIRQIRRLAAGRPAGVRLGIGDDCALLRIRPREEVAVTTDLSIDGRHFRLDWHPAESVGHRTLARGLSDIAAMGARPVGAFLSLGLPRELAKTGGRGGARAGTWIDRFFDGLFALAAAYDTPLAGGDLAESPVAMADVVLVGAVPRGRALLRSGARPGDQLYVTGALGGASAGLARLAAAKQNTLGKSRIIPAAMEAELAAHLRPQPRVQQGLWLQRRGVATAAIDVSDGLSTDLAHLCEESGVAAEVYAELLPVHAGATQAQALHGGEDYELLFTAADGARIPDVIAGVAVTKIGRMVRRAGREQVTLTSGREKLALKARGWQHFS